MSRSKNQVGTVRVSISMSTELAAYLDDLVKLGIHGKGRSEIANTMVAREVERLITQGFLTLRKPKGR